MNTSRSSLTIETGLYLLIALLALSVRLWGLGAQPLSDAESHDALLAFRFLHGGNVLADAETPASPNSPLLFSLTSFAFMIFGASDTLARLVPALAGAALTMTPAYFRRDVGPVGGLVMAALLAFSPPFVAASRSADAAMLLALTLMVAIGSLLAYARAGDRRQLYVAAIAVGAGLAAGPRVVTLVLILLIAVLLWRLLDAEGVATATGRLAGSFADAADRSPRAVGAFGGIAVGAFVLGSSALLTYRPGLAAAAQAIPAWFASWSPAHAGRDWLHLPILLIIYEPLAVLFGLAGMVRLALRRSESDRAGWLFVAGAMSAFAVGLLYAGRTSEDVIWIVIPLTGVASIFVVELLGGDWAEIDVPAVAVHAALVVVLLIYAGLNVAAFAQIEGTVSSSAQYINLALGGTAILLVIIISLLFGVGWSAEGAARGTVIGLGVVLILASISASRHLTRWGETREMASEVWHAGAPAPTSGLRLLAVTLEGVSDRAVGAPHDIEIAVNAPRDGALAWALRDFHAAAYADALSAAISPPVVIAAADQTTPELGSAYVGQSFAVRASLESASLTPGDWARWLAFRRAPLTMEKIVLWVRSDVQFRTGEGQ